MGNAVSWGAQPSIIADPGASGAIPTTEGWGVCSIVTAGVETRTLAIPQRVGQRLSLAMKTDGGNCTLTAASAINETGNNTYDLCQTWATTSLLRPSRPARRLRGASLPTTAWP
jgi:hypothetical protein